MIIRFTALSSSFAFLLPSYLFLDDFGKVLLLPFNSRSLSLIPSPSPSFFFPLFLSFSFSFPFTPFSLSLLLSLIRFEVERLRKEAELAAARAQAEAALSQRVETFYEEKRRREMAKISYKQELSRGLTKIS